MTDHSNSDGTRRIIKKLRNERDALMRLSPEAALGRILDAGQPDALVHALAAQDFHLLVNDIGPEEALPVLALASERQWEHLLDVEGWAADRLTLSGIDRWLDLLYRADPNRMVHWLASHHTEFLEIYFYRTIEVFIREHDQDSSTLPPDCISMDDVFYYRIMESTDTQDASHRDPDLCRRLVTRILERMADHDHVYYQKLFLETMNLIPAEVEEEIYRLRNVRMAEKGFLPFDEAVGIYQPMPEFNDAPAAVAAVRPSAEKLRGSGVPILPAALSDRSKIFPRALMHLGAGVDQDEIQLAFAALCNRIGIADQTIVRSRQALEAIVSKATGYLGIAIELLAGSDAGPERSANVIAGRPLADLFRIGYGAVLKLKRQAERWRADCWFQQEGLPLTFWGEQWMGVLGGLLLKRPRYFDNYRTGVIYREFAALAEVNETRENLEAIMAMDALLGAISLNPARIKSPLLTYKNLLLTAWAAARLKMDSPVSPVAAEDLRRFFTWFWKAEKPPFSIDNTRRTAFLDWLAERSGNPPEAVRHHYGEVLEALFMEIEEELGHVAIEDLEPRYTNHLLLSVAASQ